MKMSVLITFADQRRRLAATDERNVLTKVSSWTGRLQHRTCELCCKQYETADCAAAWFAGRCSIVTKVAAMMPPTLPHLPNMLGPTERRLALRDLTSCTRPGAAQGTSNVVPVAITAEAGAGRLDPRAWEGRDPVTARSQPRLRLPARLTLTKSQARSAPCSRLRPGVPRTLLPLHPPVDDSGAAQVMVGPCSLN